MDWYSQKVLGWAISNTMETGLCLEALENALIATGRNEADPKVRPLKG